MAVDLYTAWLGIASGARPPDYYTLLGLEPFCSDRDRIDDVARDRLERLDRYALHPDPSKREMCQQLMNDVARARTVLVAPAQREAYDATLPDALRRLRPAPAFPRVPSPLSRVPQLPRAVQAVPLRREAVTFQTAPVRNAESPAAMSEGSPGGRFVWFAFAAIAAIVAIAIAVVVSMRKPEPRVEVGQATAPPGSTTQSVTPASENPQHGPVVPPTAVPDTKPTAGGSMRPVEATAVAVAIPPVVPLPATSPVELTPPNARIADASPPEAAAVETALSHAAFQRGELAPGKYVLDATPYTPPEVRRWEMTLRPGVELRGGTIDLQRAGHLTIRGTPSRPVIFRNVVIFQDLDGGFSAQYAVFDHCTFSKGGAWFNIYSSKWEFNACLLYASQFRRLTEVDYGFSLDQCTLISMVMPEIEHPRTDGRPFDHMNVLRYQWNRIERCRFVDDTIPPTVFWCSQFSNFAGCRFVPGEPFESAAPPTRKPGCTRRPARCPIGYSSRRIRRRP